VEWQSAESVSIGQGTRFITTGLNDRDNADADADSRRMIAGSADQKHRARKYRHGIIFGSQIDASRRWCGKTGHQTVGSAGTRTTPHYFGFGILEDSDCQV